MNVKHKEELIDILASRYGYIKRLLAVKGATPDLQEEIAQQTIFEAYRKLGQLNDHDKLDSWLATIALRLYIKESKRISRRVVLSEGSMENDEVITETFASEYDILDEIINIENSRELMAYVDALGSKYSSIITLHYIEDKSLKDIASLLDMNYNTVRSMHMRALEKLRATITEGKGGCEHGQ